MKDITIFEDGELSVYRGRKVEPVKIEDVQYGEIIISTGNHKKRADVHCYVAAYLGRNPHEKIVGHEAFGVQAIGVRPGSGYISASAPLHCFYYDREPAIFNVYRYAEPQFIPLAEEYNPKEAMAIYCGRDEKERA